MVLKHCRRFLEYIEISPDEDHNLNMYKENIRKYFYPAISNGSNIRSNLWVSQNGRIVINLVYLGGGTMVAKIFDFRFFESLKNAISRTFCSPKLSLESWILHSLCENFPEHPPGKAIRTSVTVYLMTQDFSWFKNYKLLILKLVPGASFSRAKTKCFFW